MITRFSYDVKLRDMPLIDILDEGGIAFTLPATVPWNDHVVKDPLTIWMADGLRLSSAQHNPRSRIRVICRGGRIVTFGRRIPRGI
jgi:hypothetical protein